MSTRILSAAVICIAMSAAWAQAPSWNNGGSLSKPPAGAVNRPAATNAAAIGNVGQPPRDRDCKATIARPDKSYRAEQTKFYTDGTEDHGRILNVISDNSRLVEADLEDVQVRIEQLRCEDENIKAKLDFIIHMLTR